MTLPMTLCAFIAMQQSARIELMRVHDLQRSTHFARDAEGFVNLLADRVVMVRNGQIVSLSRRDNLARVRAYFASVTFKAWDDLEPPVLKVSADGKTAWMAVRKRVHVVSVADPSDESITEFAWIATFEKRDGRWLVTANASTQKPSS